MTRTDDGPALDPEVRRQVEQWFIAQGVPHFIDDYSASRFVLTRAAPLLVLYLVVTLAMTASFHYSLGLNALAIGVAVAVVLGGWLALNVLRGRPWRSLPDRVGLPEVLAFLVLPALPPLLVGFQVSDAILTLAESAAFLVVVYVATSYGLLSMLRWAAMRIVGQLGSLGRLLTRALPLLLVFISFVFLQNDTWQVAHAIAPSTLVIALLLFLGLSIAFLVSQLAPEVRRLARGGRDWHETLSVAARTPAAPLCPALADVGPRTTPLRWREWVNVGTLVVFGAGLQIALVTFVVQVALVLFGLLLVPIDLQAEWAGGPVAPLPGIDLLGPKVPLTGELVAVAVLLGAFSGLYFTVAALSDATYRTEFFREADQELADVFAVRAVYQTALALEAERPARTSMGTA